MCGLAGIVDFRRPASAWLQTVTRMGRVQQHRGPDGFATDALGHAALAHARLAIVDPEGGAQPMRSADGRHVIIYNGEVTNHDALRRRLSDRFPFHTRCDTEVVLAACALLGEAALPLLDGMFAFFFWDSVRQCGFAARDRLGVKPLVYRHEDGVVAVASEAKALLAGFPGPRRLHVPAFVEWVVAPAFSGVEHAPVEGVRILPPGGLLRVSRDGVDVSRWWRPRNVFDGEPPGPDETERLVGHLARTLHRAGHETARAEVPVGVLLSGGVDSTTVAALAAEIVPDLPAFTARFENQRSFEHSESLVGESDDGPPAAEAARALGLTAHWADVPRASLADDLRAVAEADDLLPAWEQQLTQHRLFATAARHVKVALVGDAADELHHGYHFLLDDEPCASPRALLRRMGAHDRVRLLAPDLARETRPLERLASRYGDLAGEAGHGWSTVEEGRRATALLVLERWLPRLLHDGDVHSMAHSVEARVPFAAIDHVALALSTPLSASFRNGEGKHLLRRAAPAAVPEGIRWRRKSAMPKDLLVERQYRALAREALVDMEDVLRPWLNVTLLRELTEMQRAATERERAMLFHAACFAHAARRWELTGP